MIARHFFVGLMTLATVSAQPRPQSPWQPSSIRLILSADHLSEEITGMQVLEVGLNGVPSVLAVILQGHVGTMGRLDGMAIQVWLLRANGTTTTQQETLPCMDCFQSIPPTDYRQFRFAPVPTRELAGVVVSVNGKFWVRAINAS
jgi:hypothetical protein